MNDHLETPMERGQRGETLAAQALTAHGYRVVAHNWHCAAGEIDLVACDGECVVFVEVKTRQGEGFGLPEEAVTAAKQAHLLAAAQCYLAENALAEVLWRIDVVAILLGVGGKVRRLTIYRDAVRADG